MLTRSVQVGEFYIMSPPRFPLPEDGKFPHACDITIYDEEKDMLVTITWKDAAIATGAFKPADAKIKPAGDGTLSTSTLLNTVMADAPSDGKNKLSDWKDSVEEWYTYINDPKGTTFPKTRPCIVLTRPFIEHMVRAPMRTSPPSWRVTYRLPVLASADAFGHPDGVWEGHGCMPVWTGRHADFC